MMDIYEPLFLLSVGAVDGDPGQNDWDIEPVSYATLESFCAAHAGETIDMFPGHVVARLLADLIEAKRLLREDWLGFHVDLNDCLTAPCAWCKAYSALLGGHDEIESAIRGGE